jgi:hypothetical protein
MSELMLRSMASTALCAPAGLHGAELLQAVPLPLGEAYRTTGVEAAWAGAAARPTAVNAVPSSRAAKRFDLTDDPFR